MFCLGSGGVFAGSSRTVIELVNMVGSAFYGPVLAVFACGLLVRRIEGRGMLLGLLGGVAANGVLWKVAPQVSWLWWNPAGFLVAVALAFGASLRVSGASPRSAAIPGPSAGPGERGVSLQESFRESRRAVLLLAAFFLLILGVTACLGLLLGGS